MSGTPPRSRRISSTSGRNPSGTSTRVAPMRMNSGRAASSPERSTGGRVTVVPSPGGAVAAGRSPGSSPATGAGFPASRGPPARIARKASMNCSRASSRRARRRSSASAGRRMPSSGGGRPTARRRGAPPRAGRGLPPPARRPPGWTARCAADRAARRPRLRPGRRPPRARSRGGSPRRNLREAKGWPPRGAPRRGPASTGAASRHRPGKRAAIPRATRAVATAWYRRRASAGSGKSSQKLASHAGRSLQVRPKRASRPGISGCPLGSSAR